MENLSEQQQQTAQNPQLAQIAALQQNMAVELYREYTVDSRNASEILEESVTKTLTQTIPLMIRVVAYVMVLAMAAGGLGYIIHLVKP